MIIDIPTELMAKLESWCATARGREVSGLGTIKVEDGNFIVTDVFLLDAGSEVLTNIPPERIAELYSTGVDPSTLKLWWHRHPVGNGVPGQQNWSGIDEDTIQNRPLGSPPEQVKWSVSMVRTPYGWVGRVDHYIKKKTVHLEVKQPLTVEGHDKIYTYLQHASVANKSLAPKKHIPMATKEEKISIVDHAVRLFGGKVRRGTQSKDWTYRKLSFYGIEEEVYEDMSELLEGGIGPIEVSEAFGYDLFTLRDIGLITWTEMEDALLDKYDREEGSSWKRNQLSYWEDEV